MEIKIYTSPGCYYCTQAKKLFERAGIKSWEEVVCTNKQMLVENYPNANSYPWIVIDDKEVGGLVETARYFIKIGLVTSKKNERT